MASHSHIAHKEKHQTFRNVDIEKIRLINNYVLCRRLTHNVDEAVNGVIYPKQMHENQRLYQNADRVYEVIAIPKVMNAFRWETDIEILPGDMVWVEVINALNAPEILDEEGNEYRLLKYQHLITAKRGEKIIPLNGNVLLSNVFTQLKFINQKFELIREPAIIYALACVEHVGKQNKSYIKTKDSDRGINLKKGQVVVLSLPNKNERSVNRKYVEEGMFAKLDPKKRYFYEQRRSILGVIENKDAAN